jgi:hypothetical protein
MSAFLKGQLSPSFFVVDGDGAPISRSDLESALSGGAFSFDPDQLQRMKAGERRWGWLSGFQGKPDFGDLNDWAPDNVYFLRISMAEKKLKSGDVNFRYKAAVAAWIEQNRSGDGEKRTIVPLGVRRQLKEEAADAIAMTTVPTVKQSSLVWLHQEGRVILDTQATWAVDLLRLMFRSATSASLRPEEWRDRVSEEARESLFPDSPSDIFQYIWAADGASVEVGSDAIVFEAQSTATLVNGDEVTKIKADATLPDHEMRSALGKGKRLSSIGVRVYSDSIGREAIGQLAASPTLSLKGFKLKETEGMTEEDGDLESTFADRLSGLLWLKRAVDKLAEGFAITQPSIWPADEDGEVDGGGDGGAEDERDAG